MAHFYPEGSLTEEKENQHYLRSIRGLEEACAAEAILEARAVVCDAEHNLWVDFGFCRGIIPREEGALGIREGTTRDIALITRVNKMVCFIISGFQRLENGSVRPILSRRAAQLRCMQEYLSTLRPGDVIPAKVTHLEPFGAFLDIGCGIPSLISIDQISISRISHPQDRFRPGDSVYAVVKSIDSTGRVFLSHRELLGTWKENAALFSAGETVAGIIRSTETYGVFVELTPNLAGLAEPFRDVHPGQYASVYIKSLLPDKMKIKLILVDAFDAVYQPPKMKYFLPESMHLDHWKYSPEESSRVIETVFQPV